MSKKANHPEIELAMKYAVQGYMIARSTREVTIEVLSEISGKDQKEIIERLNSAFKKVKSDVESEIEEKLDSPGLFSDQNREQP